MNYFKDKGLFDLKNTLSEEEINIKDTTPLPTSVSINNSDAIIINKYIERQNRSIDDNNSQLLNGVYVSKNRNALPLSILNTTNFFCARYSSSIANGVVFQNNNLSLNSNLFINFWIYPIYSAQILKPICILTKGDNKSFGEYTILISVDKKLQFAFTSNGISTILKTNNIINEKKLTFISIIKTISNVSIYVNNIRDTQLSFQVNPLKSDNPLLIGVGYNTSNLNGYIDNLTISDNINDTTNMMSIFYNYKPTDHYFIFEKGILMYNGYNYSKNINYAAPITIYDAKFFCEILENYCNGLCYNGKSYLYYSYYIDDNLVNKDCYVYEKASILTIASNDFVSIKIELEKQKNISLSQKYLLNGYYKSFTEEIYYFVNGELYQYNQNASMYQLVLMDLATAANLILIVNDIVLLEIINNKFLYYSGYVIESEYETTNTILKKKAQYNFGQNNSIIDFIGEVKIGAFNLSNTTNITPFKSIENTFINSNITSNESTIPVSKELSININNLTNNTSNIIPSYLYAYDGLNTNITGLLHTSGEYFIKTIPKLSNKLQVDFKLNLENDLIDLLLRNQITIGKQIIINYNKSLDIGLYNFSIITSSLIKIKIANRDYSINSMVPQHILFHNTSEICNIELTFYYQKINQVCKFILID